MEAVPNRLHRLASAYWDTVTIGCELCGGVFRDLPSILWKASGNWWEDCPACGQEIEEIAESFDLDDFERCMDVIRGA